MSNVTFSTVHLSGGVSLTRRRKGAGEWAEALPARWSAARRML